MKALRIAAICSSLGLLFSCVWFTQKQASPPSPAVMPGSKSGALTLMPGSKSFTSSHTISSQALQTSPPPKP